MPDAYFANIRSSLSWERRILSNGLVVLLYPRLSALTTQLSVAVRYGSNDDSGDECGTAHFLEHMLVGGSQRSTRLNHEIERLGGCSSFETSNECTFSMIDVLPETLPQASHVLSGLLFDSEFGRDKLEHERKVILAEIAEASDKPQGKNEETFLKCLFRHHPVRNPILGSKKTVNQIRLNDIKKAHEKYYSAQNMIVILSGKFSDRTVELVLSDFQDRKKGAPTSRPKRSIETGKPKKRILAKRPGIKQAYLHFGLKTPLVRNADVPTLELISALLGVGESSRLFVELREKRALTYDYDSVNVAGLDFGYFEVSCAVKTKALEQTQTVIQGELEKLKDHPVKEKELEKEQKPCSKRRFQVRR